MVFRYWYPHKIGYVQYKVSTYSNLIICDILLKMYEFNILITHWTNVLAISLLNGQQFTSFIAYFLFLLHCFLPIPPRPSSAIKTDCFFVCTFILLPPQKKVANFNKNNSNEQTNNEGLDNAINTVDNNIRKVLKLNAPYCHKICSI